jgi:hypothetical protein
MPIESHKFYAGAWRKATAIHKFYAGAWRDCTEVWKFYGGAWRQVFQKGNVQNFSGGFSKFTTFPTSATCIGFIQSNGTTNGQAPESDVGTNWFTPTTASVGVGYYVRATLSSGTTPSGTLNAWLSLSTAQSWSVTDSSGSGTGCTLSLEISADQSTVLGTGTFTLYAEATI